MWIAKPISSLTETEKNLWIQIEQDLPLAQSLNWAFASEAVGSKAYLVFSTEEKVGGIVFRDQNPHSLNHFKFECINGPALHWDSPKEVSRQIATFAMAVSKLDLRFKSLSIKPRWESGQLTQRLAALPLSPFSESQAATLIIPVHTDSLNQFEAFTSRLKRTLTKTWKNNIKFTWEKPSSKNLEVFVRNMKKFSERHGFVTPPLAWFKSLTVSNENHDLTQPIYGIASASFHSKETNAQSITQILVCFRKKWAHYLFGYEIRDPKLRSSISLSAIAHWETLRRCAAAHIPFYDLNGYTVDSDIHHPYYGVSQFKKQFAGQLVQYDVPEFVIE